MRFLFSLADPQITGLFGLSTLSKMPPLLSSSFEKAPSRNIKYIPACIQGRKLCVTPPVNSASDSSHHLLRIKSVMMQLWTGILTVMNNLKQGCSTALYHIQSWSQFCSELECFLIWIILNWIVAPRCITSKVDKILLWTNCNFSHKTIP